MRCYCILAKSNSQKMCGHNLYNKNYNLQLMTVNICIPDQVKLCLDCLVQILNGIWILALPGTQMVGCHIIIVSLRLNVRVSGIHMITVFQEFVKILEFKNTPCVTNLLFFWLLLFTYIFVSWFSYYYVGLLGSSF